MPQELDDLRPVRSRTLEITDGLSQQQLDYSPGRRWSIGEVLDHVLLVEGMLRDEIERLIELAEAGKPTLLRRRGAELDISLGPVPKSLLPLFDLPLTVASALTPKPVLDFLAGARWLPIKNPVAATPRRGTPGDELRRELRDSPEAFAALLSAHPQIDYTKLVHRHPLMGANTVPEMLRFIANHERRHQLQIRDVLHDSGFPAPAREAAS